MTRSTSTRVRRVLGAHGLGFVALFVALGGPAGAAAIITSNSQVGPAVIAGASGPAGSTDNVIAGSIGTADLGGGAVRTPVLADDAVTSGAIANRQVATADLANGSATSASVAPGAVGPATLAHGAVTANELAGDLRRRIAISLSPATGGFTADDVLLGSLELAQSCTVPYAGAAPEMWLTPSNLSGGDTGEFELSGIAQSAGAAPRLVLSSTSVGPGASQSVLDGVSNEQGTGTLVWRLGAETYQGTIHWLVDQTHCELSGVLMASH